MKRCLIEVELQGQRTLTFSADAMSSFGASVHYMIDTWHLSSADVKRKSVFQLFWQILSMYIGSLSVLLRNDISVINFLLIQTISCCQCHVTLLFSILILTDGEFYTSFLLCPQWCSWRGVEVVIIPPMANIIIKNEIVNM